MPDPKSPKATTTESQNGRDRASLQAASSWSNIVVVGLGVLTAIAGVLALYFSQRLKALEDADFARFQLESTERIAVANSEAAKANERAAEAHLETAKIREKLTARTLNTEQRERITEKFKAFVGTEFRADTFQDQESLNLTYVILAMLREAGWIQRPSKTSITISTLYGPIGATMTDGIHIFAEQNQMPTATAVANALRDEGLDAEAALYFENTSPQFRILIGKKW
jgi:hypothetical protein